jgi:undecaprenyl-diphosphatase
MPAVTPRRFHRRWVIMFVVASATLAALAAGVAWSEPLVHLDDAVAAGLHAHAERSLGTVRLMLVVTWLGTWKGYAVLAPLVVGGFMAAARPRLGLAWLAVVIAGGLWVDGLKNTFDRPRPQYNSEFTTERSYSFPSAHASSAAVAYGMLAYCLALHWRASRQRLALAFGFGTLVLLIGFTRLYLGVHYLSDVLAGYALALAWVGFCIWALEMAGFNRSPQGHPNTPAAGRIP